MPMSLYFKLQAPHRGKKYHHRLPQIDIKVHLRMHTFKRYLHAKCQIPAPMHKERRDERLGGCDLALRNGICSANDKVVN